MKLREVYENYESYDLFVEAVNKHLKRLMEENPDFVYGTGGCSYNSGPVGNRDLCSGCIFGQALQALGWSDPNELSSGHYIDYLFADYVGIVVPDYWLNIQEQQDSGMAWGTLVNLLP